MTDWPLVSLAKVADLCLGKMLDKKKNKGVHRPYLANINVRWGALDLEDLREMRFEDREIDRYGLRVGDIVMCEGGEPGRCVLWAEQVPGMMIQKALHRIRPSEEVDSRFLFYSLFHKGRSGALERYFTGATIKHLPREQLAKVEVTLPPLDTQRCIASILSSYDDLIGVNRRRVAVLEEIARGLFEEWFVRFRFPGHESVPIIESPDGPLPQGWSVRSLAELCGRITDGAHRSPASVDVGKPMASVRDMRDWGFDYSACRTIGDSEWDELARGDCRPLVGDILIAKDGANLNKHTFLVWREEPVVLLSSIAIIRALSGVQREFLTATLRSSSTDAAIKNMKSGAAIPRIVLKDFKRLPIVWPTEVIRDEFERLIQPLHQQCRLLVEANQRLSASRDLLLPRLISGQVSVEAAERELELAA